MNKDLKKTVKERMQTNLEYARASVAKEVKKHFELISKMLERGCFELLSENEIIVYLDNEAIPYGALEKKLYDQELSTLLNDEGLEVKEAYNTDEHAYRMVSIKFVLTVKEDG